MANKDNKNDDMKEFEEEFDFESSEAKEDALGIEEEEEALATPKETPNRPAATPGIQLDRKPSKLPLLIGLTIVGFIGWQGYKMLFSSPSNDEIAVPTLKESHPPVAIAPAAAPPKTSIPVAAPTPVTPPPEALAPVPKERAMGFWDHLEELRGTIIKSVIAFVVFAVLIGYFIKEFNDVDNCLRKLCLQEFCSSLSFHNATFP